MHAEVFDVDVAAKACIEHQIPTRMMIVVVDVDAIAVPLPIAASVEVVRRDHPSRVVIKNYVACAVVNAAGDKNFSHVLVAPIGIGVTGTDAVVIGVPVTVMRIVRIIPAFVFAVVVIAAVIVAVLVPTFVLAIVLTVVAVLTGRRNSEDSRQ